MIRTTSVAPLIVAMTLWAGCDREGPLAPTPPAQVTSTEPPSQPLLASFRDPDTGFSTTDLRDADGHIVQVQRNGTLIWTADGSRFDGYRPVNDITVDATVLCKCWLEVRFGTENGERRAYLTADYGHWNEGFVVRLSVTDGELRLKESNVFPPGTFTLSGTVSEVTSFGRAPVEGAWVSFVYGSGSRIATTDERGYYEIPGLYARTDRFSVSKDGYVTEGTVIALVGDTELDVVLKAK